MRKTILIFISLIMIASSIFAGAPGVNPQNGGFGINMASTNYNFEDAAMSISYDDNGKGDGKKTYGDEHMVALGGVWNMESTHIETSSGMYQWSNKECETPMTVIVNCPNGFYFESISNAVVGATGVNKTSYFDKFFSNSLFTNVRTFCAFL